MIEEASKAWRFIFNHHPDGENIMKRIMDPDFRVTVNLFRKWFYEARATN